MINKLKREILKNTLEKTERLIFESLCNTDKKNSLSENKKKAIELAKMDFVKKHHIGNIFKNESLRNALLSTEELNILNQAFSFIDEFEACNTIIKKNNYKILCSPELMQDFLFNCKNISEAKVIVNTFEKELKNLNSEIVKQSIEDINKSNDEVLINTLDSSQKESLSNLGLSYNDGDCITLQKLKKLYYDKLYGVNSNNVNINKLSEDFFNIKKSFKIS